MKWTKQGTGAERKYVTEDGRGLIEPIIMDDGQHSIWWTVTTDGSMAFGFYVTLHDAKIVANERMRKAGIEALRMQRKVGA